jgi:hypothetical protein
MKHPIQTYPQGDKMHDVVVVMNMYLLLLPLVDKVEFDENRRDDRSVIIIMEYLFL